MKYHKFFLFIGLFFGIANFAMSKKDPDQTSPHRIEQEGELIVRYELNPNTRKWEKTESYNPKTGIIAYYEAKVGGGSSTKAKYYSDFS